MPPPSSLTSMTTRPERWAAESVTVPTSDLPAASLCSGDSNPWSIALRIMWVSGSTNCSITVLSTSVDSPSVTKCADFCARSEASRTMRAMRWNSGFTGCARIAITFSWISRVRLRRSVRLVINWPPLPKPASWTHWVSTAWLITSSPTMLMSRSTSSRSTRTVARAEEDRFWPPRAAATSAAAAGGAAADACGSAVGAAGDTSRTCPGNCVASAAASSPVLSAAPVSDPLRSGSDASRPAAGISSSGISASAACGEPARLRSSRHRPATKSKTSRISSSSASVSSSRDQSTLSSLGSRFSSSGIRAISASARRFPRPESSRNRCTGSLPDSMRPLSGWKVICQRARPVSSGSTRARGRAIGSNAKAPSASAPSAFPSPEAHASASLRAISVPASLPSSTSSRAARTRSERWSAAR